MTERHGQLPSLRGQLNQNVGSVLSMVGVSEDPHENLPQTGHCGNEKGDPPDGEDPQEAFPRASLFLRQPVEPKREEHPQRHSVEKEETRCRQSVHY